MNQFYKIIKYITFPGTLLKGFLEQMFCRIYKVPINDSEYMQNNELCGHVDHELAGKTGSFCICWFPHIIMLLLGLAVSFPAAVNFFYLGKFDVLSLILFYVGVSFLTNCNPLEDDVLNMWDYLYGRDSSAKMVSKIFLAIPAAIMYGFAYVEKYGLTILTGMLFCGLFPYFVALFFPA